MFITYQFGGLKNFNKIFLTIGLLFIFNGIIGQGLYFKDPNKRNIRGNSKVNAFTARFMPALYLNTIGIELEYPITKHVTVGINLLGKSARTDYGGNNVFKTRPETVDDAAWKSEFAIKFYFPYDLFQKDKKIGYNAPVGFYLQANASFGSLYYFDGTNRPYTMHSKWKKFDGGIRNPSEIVSPQPISLGGGFGFQAIVIPQHIVANIMIGSQLYFNSGKVFAPYLGFYVAPSIGYLF